LFGSVTLNYIIAHLYSYAHRRHILFSS